MGVNALLASKNFHIDPRHILVGNGAAELIKALMEHTKGKVGCIFPTFEEYPNRLPADRIIAFRPGHAAFHYEASDVIAFFDDKPISTLILINPDNPSGNLVCTDGLQQILAWAEARQIRLIIDESFADFADPKRRMVLLRDELLKAHPGLIVVKSISKSYGVPGLRLGILASGDTTLISLLKKEVSIWNINSFGEFFLQIYEKYQQDYETACILFRQEREHFFEALSQIPWLEICPSQANYFLCRVIAHFTAHELTLRLLEHNILIKDCSTKKGFEGGDYIRIAIRDRKDNERLVEILQQL
jgi:histidinol-phosphate/aromatic aminotransferase/cobyric acid decarboxylase-like protein